MSRLWLMLALAVLCAEAAPQGRFNRRRFNGNRRRFRPNSFNQQLRPNSFNQQLRPSRPIFGNQSPIGNIVRPFFGNGGGSGGGGGGGSSNTQANANVVQGTNGNNQVTQVSANVLNQQQSNPNGISLSGGIALASNLQLNSPFGNINLSDAQAQTINQGQNFQNFFPRTG